MGHFLGVENKMGKKNKLAEKKIPIVLKIPICYYVSEKPHERMKENDNP